MENKDSKHVCFLRWMNLQEEDLTLLLQALNLYNSNGDHNHTSELNQLVDKNISHYQEYVTQRAALARDDVYPYFLPPWCSSLEGSMLWTGGCRPSIHIRLLYALSGKEIIEHIDEFLNGNGVSTVLGDLSSTQYMSINNLHLKTIKQEDEISRKLGSLQEEEEIADEPIVIIAKELLQAHSEASAEADKSLDALSVSMKSLLEQADNLRLNTLN